MLRLLIALSLITNVALAAVFLARSSPARGVTSSAGGGSATTFSTSTSDSSALTRGGRPSSDSAVAALQWSKLNPNGDLAELVARLRAAGFPTAVIRAVVSGVLGQEFIDRRNALTTADAELPFWKDSSWSRDPQVAAAIRAMSREHAGIMRDLLGAGAVDEFDESLFYQQHLYGGVLSPEKIQRVQEISRDYNELMWEIRSSRVLFPEDREALAKLEQEQRADLAAVLTPEELEAHDLRTSNTASALRWQSAALNLNEAEFLALYRATASVEQRLGPSAQMRSPNAAREKVELVAQQLQGVLPTERIQQFVEASDPQYAQTARLVARLQLPSSVTKEVVAIQKDAMDRLAAIGRDGDVSPDARRAAVEQIATDATAKLSEKLGGARGLDAYKLNGGQWLNTLTGPGRPLPPR